MDPKQLFVISAISREGIAEELSEIMEGGEGIKPDDPKLTDEFCQEFANGLYQIETDTIGMSENTKANAEQDFASIMLQKLG